MKYNAMKKGSKTDWKRLNEIGDETIDTSDIPELDEEFFQRAKIMCVQTHECTASIRKTGNPEAQVIPGLVAVIPV